MLQSVTFSLDIAGAIAATHDPKVEDILKRENDILSLVLMPNLSHAYQH
jgi:hypothetical protein